MLFQSTPSVWKATKKFELPVYYDMISIHAFRVEGDSEVLGNAIKRVISIHAFRVEGDDEGDFFAIMCVYFNPRLPCGRRQYNF